ncbi:hypothetical protein ACFQOZ_18565 [Comamonas endophytica]|uniref:hypothetical protein n=1 Tax=Comamonas endophytica TaxID=2949090 RepID=UPI003614E360
MTKPVRHHKQYKLVSDFKKLVADAKHTFKELADGPAFKDFRAELRHTEHELKHNAAEVKAAVKDAAREIKAAFKNTDAHLKHLPAEPASPGNCTPHRSSWSRPASSATAAACPSPSRSRSMSRWSGSSPAKPQRHRPLPDASASTPGAHGARFGLDAISSFS